LLNFFGHEEFGLAELDGILPWPGKKLRKLSPFRRHNGRQP
jgi:hypothetical protein